MGCQAGAFGSSAESSSGKEGSGGRTQKCSGSSGQRYEATATNQETNSLPSAHDSMVSNLDDRGPTERR
jgi:hypothetical protein